MAYIAADDFTTTGQTGIFPADVNERIEYLKKTIREAQQDGDEPFDEDVQEYDELIAFRAEVEQATGADFDTATIVPDEQFEDYAREYAEEAALADINFLVPFVKWDKFADSLKADYRRLDFGDDLVWVRA